MSAVPPAGAEHRITAHALEFLQKVQTELGTTNKTQIAVVAIGGIMRAAKAFGISSIELMMELRRYL